MATGAQVKAIADEKNVDTVGMAAASAAVFNAGAQIINSSGTATQITAVTDDATFVGIAGGSTLTGLTDEIPVHRVCIVYAPLATGDYTFAQALLSDVATSDIYTFADGSAANTIAWFNQVDETGISIGDVYVNVFMLKKFFAVNA